MFRFLLEKFFEISFPNPGDGTPPSPRNSSWSYGHDRVVLVEGRLYAVGDYKDDRWLKWVEIFDRAMNTCAVEADLNIRRFVSAVFVHDDRILVDEQISGHCKTTHEISQSPACVVLRQLSTLMRRRLKKLIRFYRANRQTALWVDSTMITVIAFGKEWNAESNGDFRFVRFVLFRQTRVEDVVAQW